MDNSGLPGQEPVEVEGGTGMNARETNNRRRKLIAELWAACPDERQAIRRGQKIGRQLREKVKRL